MIKPSYVNNAFNWVVLFFSPLTFASLLFLVICKFSSDNHFAFLHFFFLGAILVTTSNTMLQTSFHSSSGTLPDLISLESICHLHCIILKDYIQVIPEWPSGFSCFVQFKPKFCYKVLMVRDTVNSRSSFCWLYRFSPSSAAKNIISLISVDHLVMSMCRVISCVFGRGYLL